MKHFFKYLLAFSMIFAGLNHFFDPDFYLQIMPPYLPWHLFLVYFSGLLETLFGVLLCIPSLTKVAAWGLIAVFIGIFPANLHMALYPATYHLPIVLLWLRLPLQGLLIAWAYVYTRPSGKI